MHHKLPMYISMERGPPCIVKCSRYAFRLEETVHVQYAFKDIGRDSGPICVQIGRNSGLYAFRLEGIVARYAFRLEGIVARYAFRLEGIVARYAFRLEGIVADMRSDWKG